MQRLAIARALAFNPPILLADEPTGNLDSATGQQIIDLILALHRDMGTTLVLVTHDHNLAASMERVISLRDGRIESDQLSHAGSMHSSCFEPFQYSDTRCAQWPGETDLQISTKQSSGFS